MAINAVRQGSLGQPTRQHVTAARFPAPSKGIDARTPYAAASPEICLYSYNLVPSEGGVGLRKGFREWQIAVDNGAGISVNTIMPYDGLAADGSDDRLFAVSNEGIWDVTTPEAAPVLKATFATQTEDAGFGVFIAFITDAGTKFVAYADSLNGLYSYDVGTDTWAVATGITGPTIANVNFITAHKGRIWLIERESSDAWYLDIGAIAGAATKFYYGSKFKSGGALRGLFSWTVDGGNGVDDLLVGVSGAGDVIVYQGDDPTSANWEVRGVYFIGNLPKGPKFATEQGGELYLLSTYGVIGMQDLLNGVALVSAANESASAKLAGQLRTRMTAESDLNGWSIRSIPSEGGLLISAPVNASVAPTQYYYNLAVGGWGIWRDLDIRSFATWKNAVVFGDSDLRVLYMDQNADEVKITAPTPPLPNAEPIQFSILTSFNPMGDASLHKKVQYVRPDVIGAVQPDFEASARYDYTLTEAGLATATLPEKIAVWDVDDWDAAVWGASAATGWSGVYGSAGVGRNVAVAYRGQSYNSFTLIGWDVMAIIGGMM